MAAHSTDHPAIPPVAREGCREGAIESAVALRSRPAVVVLAAFLFLWNLGGYDLWAPDEPYFGEGAREMVADGHWTVPYVGGQVSTDKPPLFFWAIALASLPGGHVTSWTARLPSALAALLALLLTMGLARTWWGEREAVLAGLLLTTTLLFWRQARSSQIDALLCALVLAALTAFERWDAGAWPGRAAGACFWLAAALATLAKGPVGLLIPLGIALSTLAVERRLGRWRELAPWLGPLLFALPVGAWAWASSFDPSGYSVGSALRRHFLERTLHGMHHRHPPWYYLGTLPVGLLPWTGLAIAGLLLAWRARRQRRELWLLLVWSLGMLGAFSLATEKRDLYLLPAVPAFALLAAFALAALLGWVTVEAPLPDRRWATWSVGLAGGVLAATGLGLPFVVRRPVAGLDLRAAGFMLAGALLVGGAAVLLALGRRGLHAGVLALSFAFVATCLLAQTALLPALDPIKSVRPLAATLRSATREYRQAGLPIYAYDLGNVPRALAFYSDGVYLRELDGPADLLRALSGPPPVYAVLSGRALAGLPPPLRGRCRRVAASQMSRLEVVLVAVLTGEGSPRLQARPAPLPAAPAATPATR